VQGELALALGISPAQTSALVEALRKRGFLQHERSPLDRRRQIWRLTAEGEALLIEMGAAIADLAKRVDAEVTLDQQRLADELSEQLLEVLLERPRLKAFDPEQAEQLQDGGAR
jgi:DNA-binding MarR family transcriptional regulator